MSPSQDGFFIPQISPKAKKESGGWFMSMTQQEFDFGWDDLKESETKRKQKSDKAVKKAAKKKRKAKPMTPEEMAEKWKEILNNPKNSKPDQRRLEETFQAWQA